MKKYNLKDVLIYLNNIIKRKNYDILDNFQSKRRITSLLKKACKITKLSISELLARICFKPNSSNIEDFEAFLAELRAIFWLRNFGFSNIIPIEPRKKFPRPDFLANYKGKKSAIEVFCLTKTHEQQKDQTLNVYVNFNPQFEGSKFGRDFISKAQEKLLQLDNVNTDIKILLCVVNSEPMICLNDKDKWDKNAEYLFKRLNLESNYYIGILTGAVVNGELTDTIYPKIK
jgi:hypothetical protein